MPYIGKEPVIGNFVKLDAISVVNGQAAYTMNNGGSAFTAYNNVNQFLVSLNGVLQAPTDSFTVSGSTLTFASNLSTGDVIDFVIVLGNTLDIGTPSDNTVTAAKIGANAVTSAKLNNDITWLNGTAEIPKADIEAKQQELQADYNTKEYQRNRRKEYPSIVDQLDDIYHNGIDGWKTTIKAVKDKYPKE